MLKVSKICSEQPPIPLGVFLFLMVNIFSDRGSTMRLTVLFSPWIVRMAMTSYIPHKYSLADQSLMKGGTQFLGQSCHSGIEVGTATADSDVGWVIIGKQGHSDLDRRWVSSG